MDISALQWDNPSVAVQSLQKLYAGVLAKAVDSRQWYITHKKVPKLAAQWLRGLAALFVALGFLVPVVALLSSRVPSSLGYVFFVGAGGCLLINKGLGISSSWIRYMTTAFELSTALDDFQFAWAQAMASLEGKPAKTEKILDLMKMLRRFHAEVNRIVEEETNTWAIQFNEDLAYLEKMVQTRMQGAAVGKPLPMNRNHEPDRERPDEDR